MDSNALDRHITGNWGEDQYADDEICEICGKHVDNCICPECPVCEAIGDPDCYEKHGLVRSKEQIDSLKQAEEEWQKAIDEENEMWDEMHKDWYTNQSEKPIFVYCSKCGQINEKEVEHLGIEEDIFGADLLTFKCKCGEIRKSNRRG